MYPELWLDKKGSSHTSQIVGSLLSAYHGLIAWDWLHDPRYYEKLLLPGVKVPPTIRYKKDIGSPLDAPRAAAPANDDPESVTGAAEIHVSIAYRGDGLPSVDLLRRRQALERRLEADGAGEVTDAGAGEGVMDLYLATQDARRALPLVRRAIAELGFGDDASIEVEDLG
jgi:hypothetical protein